MIRKKSDLARFLKWHAYATKPVSTYCSAHRQFLYTFVVVVELQRLNYICAFLKGQHLPPEEVTELG